jgi:DNA-binding NarL/FixJ family response regulator
MTLKSEWKRIALYGLALAAGTTVLQWLDYQRFAHLSSLEIYVALVAAGFLALGLVLGMRLLAAPAQQRPEGNPEATAALGISPRELAVLQALAAGLSNKEIARELGVSPNTIKTHVTRLFEKLDAHRRTDAINKARQLGIVP